MICCASLALALFAGGAVTPVDSTPPAALAARVRGEIARLWHADPAQLRLQWGQLPLLTPASDSAPVRIVGNGVDGWLVAVIEAAGESPRAMRVRAGIARTVPVAAHALRRGEPIAMGDIVTREETVWSAAAPPVIAELGGWEVRHDVAEGTVMTAALLQAPRVIGAGDRVVFRWRRHGVQIEREAVALGPARLGEIVRARTTAGRIEGLATGHDLAELQAGTP